MRILVQLPLNERQKQQLEAAAPTAEFKYVKPKEVTKEDAQEAEIVIGNVSSALLAGSRNLRWVQLNSAGIEGYGPDILPGIDVTCATGAYGLALSEHMLGMLLTLMKKLDRYRFAQEDHTWKSLGTVRAVRGSRALVVGCGDAGGAFARLLDAMGAEVTGIRRHPGQDCPYYLRGGLYTTDKLDELLPDMDIVACALPGTAESYHMFDERRLLLMKADAYLLNMGRGNAIDNDALAKVLNSGHLAGAALDVTEPEPLPADHPLWTAREVFITPHISGKFNLPETLDTIVDIASENLRRYLTGEPLKNLVDFELGYRKFEGQ